MAVAGGLTGCVRYQGATGPADASVPRALLSASHDPEGGGASVAPRGEADGVIDHPVAVEVRVGLHDPSVTASVCHVVRC
jgi:hypothetical protein